MEKRDREEAEVAAEVDTEVKRAKVDGEEEEVEAKNDENVNKNGEEQGAESDDDDEGDEEDDDEDDDDDDDDNDDPADVMFSLEDFEDVPGLTEEDLEVFQQAFNEFVEELATESEQQGTEQMLLQKPTALRPVPKTKQDFWDNLIVAQIPPDAQAKKVAIGEAFAELQFPIPDDADVNDEEKMSEYLREHAKKQILILTKELEEYEKLLSDEKYDTLFMMLLVFTDVCFDRHDAQNLFSTESDVKGVTDMLDRLAVLWKKTLSQTEEVLKVTAKVKKGVRSFIGQCITDLRSGELLEDEEENPFAAYEFKLEWSTCMQI